MGKAPTKSRQPLDEYVRLLIELHELIANGNGDGDEADAVRDAMDVPWQRLSDAQQSLVEDLSADLYTLQDDDVIRHPMKAGVLSQRVADELSRADAAGDHRAALAILRKYAAEISAGHAAELRALLYERIGLPSVARLFHRRAEELGQTQSPAAVKYFLG